MVNLFSQTWRWHWGVILGLGPAVLLLGHLHGSPCIMYHKRDHIAQMVLHPGSIESKLHGGSLIRGILLCWNGFKCELDSLISCIVWSETGHLTSESVSCLWCLPTTWGSVVCVELCMSYDTSIISTFYHKAIHSMLLSFLLRPQNHDNRSSHLGSTPSCSKTWPKTDMKLCLCWHFSHLKNQYSVVCLIALLLLNESL